MNQTLEVFASGSFQVTVTDINGCTGEATFDVTETPSLMPVISGSLQFCEGSNTILDAGSGYAEYIWSTGETAQVITVTDEDQYSVTVTDLDGCSGAAAVTTMIHDNPDVMIGGSTTYCIGGSTTLDAGSGYTSYLWSNGSISQTILVTTPGTFTVDVVDINGCTGSATVTVNESTSLSPVITGINAFCENGSTILNAGSGFASYQWSDGSTGQTLLVNTAGMYSVSVSDGQGCFGNSSVTVTEVAPPFAQLMPNATICNRQGMASIMDLYDLVIAGDMNGTWSDIDQSGAQGLFNNLDFSNVAAGDYRFMYTTNSATAPCPESEYEVVITVNESPDVLIASAPMLDCNNASVMLDADGSSTGPEYDILWTGPGIVVDGNEKTLHPTIDKPGNYQLTITNTLTGCAGTSSVVVNQNADAPSGAIIIANEKKCSADEDASIFIQSVSGGTAPYQFQLNNGAFTSQDLFNNLLPGDYSIVVEDANGCRWDTMITFSAPNIFSIDLGSDIEIELGESAFIQAIVNLPPGFLDTIIWTPQNGIQCLDPFCAEVDASVIGTQLLTATAIDINGCEESDEILITVDRERKLFIPTAFSPNGDGYNDEFYIQGNAHKIESILKFEVYTRWGELLYSAGDVAPNDPSKGWDGKYKNHFINPGVYVYKAEIRYADGFTENLTGDVTVVR